MKKMFLLMSLIVFSGITQAAEESSLAAISSVYNATNEADLLESNYWLSFDFSSSQLSQQLQESSFCKKAKNFRASNVTEISKIIGQEVNEGIDRGFGKSKEASELQKELNEALEEFQADFGAHKIKICIDNSIPAYSDGHEMKFVQVNGAIKFVFEVGYPD